ncbi:MarR family transcriptional regulator [Sphingomonadaceae bacterium jetA1]|jgi:DNA-binding MarR family transcriptional regulator|uniref:MarR family winged helix-turn-helix transcriptional regulator n=1 Tax=Facivitalis istanbulensis TaxID=3075838 RepID=UPI00348495A4
MPDRDNLIIRYGRIYMRLHRLLDRRMAAEGASLARTKMLLFIANRAPARAADLADFFNLAPRTVTQAIDTMERDGLVRRMPDPVDRRVKRLDITDSGRQVIKQTEPLRLELVRQAVDVLTEEETQQLDHILTKLDEAITTRLEDGVPSWPPCDAQV